jgi:hypothetical protein
MCRWEDNIKIDVKEIEYLCGLYSFGSELESLECSCEHGNEHMCSMKGGKYFDYLGNY